MIKVNFSKVKLKLKIVDNTNFVYDEIRKKWLVLTPEEWVRQHIIAVLITDVGYSKKHIALEKQIKVNKQNKRFDIVVYNKTLVPWILIECKEPGVKLNDETLQQILSYQLVLNASFFAITNGNETFLFQKNNEGTVKELTEWPKWV